MPVMDVRLHCDATVELAPEDALAFKTRLQAALDRVIEPLQEMGRGVRADRRVHRGVREEGATHG